MFLSLLYYIQCLAILSGPNIADDHAIYVSVIEISQSSIDKPGTVKVKVFTDDLDDAIYNQSGKRISLALGCEKNLSLVADYLTKHLKIRINGRAIAYTIRGCEKNDISHWIDFEFTSQKNWQNIEISSDLLLELFPTQSNVFSVKYKDQTKMFRLTNSNKTEILKF